MDGWINGKSVSSAYNLLTQRFSFYVVLTRTMTLYIALQYLALRSPFENTLCLVVLSVNYCHMKNSCTVSGLSLDILGWPLIGISALSPGPSEAYIAVDWVLFCLVCLIL
jgi:hypothetical protein